MLAGMLGLLLLGTDATPVTWTVVLEETFEARGVGERCDWKDHRTIADASFAGVSAQTASPFDGGWRSYTFYRHPGASNGWALLDLDPARMTTPLRITLDVMIPDGGGGVFQLHRHDGQTWTGLQLSADGLAMASGPNRLRKLTDLKSHVWYRVVMQFQTPGATTFSAIVLEDQPGQPARQSSFTDLPVYRPGRALGRLKITSANGQRFYFDNLRIETAAPPSAEPTP